MPHHNSCRSCGYPLTVTFADLGHHPPSNSLLRSRDDFRWEQFYPLCAAVCDECWLVQLDHDVDPNNIFTDYVYFSSQSHTWLDHAQEYCMMAARRFKLSAASQVAEIASNDGYLLRNFKKIGVPCYGVEPARNVADVAIEAGIPTETWFLNSRTAAELVAKYGKSDLVVANNVLAHVPNINDFVVAISMLLKPNGTATFEFPHLVQLIQKCEWDTIYHEHYSYLSLLALEPLFKRHGLTVYDVEKLPTHGGSLRLYVGRRPAEIHESVAHLRAEERDAGLDKAATYKQFAMRVAQCRSNFNGFLGYVKASNKTIMGYGAAAKGNTFLNYCNLGPFDIWKVADTTPAKIGKYLPGGHIPVCSENELIAAKPDYVLILPWNWCDEIRKRLSAVVEYGGRFVTAIPEVKVWNQ